MKNKKLLIPVGLLVALLLVAVFTLDIKKEFNRESLSASIFSSITSIFNPKVNVFFIFDETPGAAEEALVRGVKGKIERSFHIVPAIEATISKKTFERLLQQQEEGIPRPFEVELVPEFELTQSSELEASWPVARVGADRVWDEYDLSGEGVNIAVLDTGIDYTHPELAAIYAGGYDYINKDEDPMDDNGHGTMVSGVIASALDGQGSVGVAPNARIYAFKICTFRGICGGGNVLAALEWLVDQNLPGFTIANHSYGSTCGQNGKVVNAAFQAAFEAGVLSVAAAGNRGDVDGRGDNVIQPACYQSVIAVAATDQNDERVSYSSTGNDLELSAPIFGQAPWLGGGYVTSGGTSSASPFVVGVAALVSSTGITDPGQIRQILNDTAIRLGKGSWYGNGLVDAYAAVSQALGQDPTDPDTNPNPDPSTVSELSVAPIEYRSFGGKTGDNNLTVTIAILDADTNNPVPGVDVTASFINTTTNTTHEVVGSTDTQGMISFGAKNAPTGCYTTVVDELSLVGATWDGVTPTEGNQFCKQ